LKKVLFKSKEFYSMKKYLDIAAKILKEGTKHEDRTGTGTIRIFGNSTEYNLSEGFPLVTTKKVAFRLIIEELIWFISGSTNEKKLAEKNVKIWSGNASQEECAKFGREAGDLGPGIYGATWRNYGATKREVALKDDYWSEVNQRWVNRANNDDGVDQLKELVDGIVKTPNSRRLIVVAFDPLTAKTTNPPPCHSFFHVQVNNGKINLALTQRSGDIFLGIPYNIAQMALLIHLLAMVTNNEPGAFVHQINDAHIYLNHMDQMKEQITRTPFPLPQIKINPRLKGMGMAGLLDFKASDIELIGYQHHAEIKGKMSV
jgi:thymidylate synthase